MKLVRPKNSSISVLRGSKSPRTKGNRKIISNTVVMRRKFIQGTILFTIKNNFKPICYFVSKFSVTSVHLQPVRFLMTLLILN